MATIQISELKRFCRDALVQEGMKEEHAAITAEVLAETDAFGTSSQVRRICTAISKRHAWAAWI